MPSPIVNIGYTRNGLEISFINLSLNLTPDSTYIWDFGDGNNSTEKDPVHVYSEEGAYLVKLTVNDPSGDGQDTQLINLAEQPIPTLMTDIPAMVDLYAPTSIVGLVKNHKQKDLFIAKWQIYLQPLVENTHVVNPDDTHNPQGWPPLVNSLIAKLVVIDIILADSTAFLLNVAHEGQSASTTTQTGSNTSSQEGSIKSIETGPTKIERYENKDASSNSEKITNLGKAYQQLIRPGSLLDELKASTCQEAQRVDLYLPMCGPLPSRNMGIIIAKPCKKSGHNANPFGVTKRML